MKKLILVAGKARHGKDSFAEEIEKDFDCEILTMSGPLWSVIARQFKVKLDWLLKNKDNEQSEGLTYRHHAQFIGNDIVPGLLGKYVWCQELQKEINDSKHDVIFITGIRLLKEVDFFKKMNKNVEVVKVIRLNNDGSEYVGVSDSDSQHSTEKEVDLIEADYTYKAKNMEELNEFANQFKNKIK